MKRLVFYLIFLVLILATIELISFIYFKTQQERFTFYDSSGFVLTDKQLEKARPKFDPITGWSEKYNTPYGERPRKNSFPDSLMATFGDSFTNCVGVEDDETWQHHLSDSIGKTVFNFGVGGFGMGQTLIHFRQNYDKVKTPIVTYGFTAENLSRAINVYRPFYFKKTGVTLPKPRFFLENGELVLWENPIQKEEDLNQLQNQNFFIRIGAYDYWYNHNNLPHFTFPFTSIFFNESYQYELMNGKYDDLKAVNREIWKQEEFANLGFAMFDAFVEEATAKGAIPILVFIPTKFDNYAFFENRLSGRHRIIKEYCESKGYLFFDGAEVMGGWLKENPEKGHKTIYHHHINSYGTTVFAEGFLKFLREKELLE